jgi:uncharacterized protein YbjT (DUF2867 family)
VAEPAIVTPKVVGHIDPQDEIDTRSAWPSICVRQEYDDGEPDDASRFLIGSEMARSETRAPPSITGGRILVLAVHPLCYFHYIFALLLGSSHDGVSGIATGHAWKGVTVNFTVIGGTGLIGSKVVQKLTEAGHRAVPAAPSTGVDLITGEGLDEALEGADVVVNVANSPTFDDASADFFRTSMTNLLAAGERAGVRHQEILSIVGVDRVPEMDYYRAKTLQEDLLRSGPAPYSIVRATQFFEFMDTVVAETSDATTVRLPATRLQPIAADDVADEVAEVATGAPLNGIRSIAGPDVFPLDELGRLTLTAEHDGRIVVTDDKAGMFAPVTGDVLTAGPGAHLASTHYRDWLQTAR